MACSWLMAMPMKMKSMVWTGSQSVLLFRTCRSSNDSPLPDIFLTMFFMRHRGWWRLSFNDCIKRWRWSRYFTSLAAWNTLYNTRVLDYCLQRKFEPWFKIIFWSVRTSSRSSCTPKDIANKKLYSEELWSFGNVPSVFCKHRSFFCFVFWTT